MSEPKSRDELALHIDEAEWQWLKPHLERGTLITVAEPLDLAEVGERISADDTGAVGEWIAAGAIGKPTNLEIAHWDGKPGKKFLMLVVSPYVLIQPIGTIN
jgi:hypothetical protein